MSSAFAFDVFLSHNHNDSVRVEALARTLTEEQGLPVVLAAVRKLGEDLEENRSAGPFRGTRGIPALGPSRGVCGRAIRAYRPGGSGAGKEQAQGAPREAKAEGGRGEAHAQAPTRARPKPTPQSFINP